MLIHFKRSLVFICAFWLIWSASEFVAGTPYGGSTHTYVGLSFVFATLYGWIYIPIIYIAGVLGGTHLFTIEPTPFNLMYPAVQAVLYGITGFKFGQLWREQSSRFSQYSAVTLFSIGLGASFLSAIAAYKIQDAYQPNVQAPPIEVFIFTWTIEFAVLMISAPVFLLLYKHFLNRGTTQINVLFGRYKDSTLLSLLISCIAVAAGASALPVLSSVETNLVFLPLIPITLIALTHGIINGIIATLLSGMTLLFITAFTGEPHSSEIDLHIFMAVSTTISLIVGGASNDKNEAIKKAEQANRSKSHFLANMSHELRTPLNAIIGFSDMVKSEVLGPIQPQQYGDYVRDIHGSGQHLLSLINEILDMSKIEAGEFTVFTEALDLSEAIEEASMFLSFQAEDKNITLILDIPDTLPFVQADNKVTKQILINLISNAVKFTPEGGQIEIKAYETTDSITVRISDNGIGISPDDLERALQPFVQIEREFQRYHDGTGLGLPLCKNFAELQGGAFTLNSEEGRGTQASFSIPVSHDMPVAITAKPVDGHVHKGRWLPSMSVGVSTWDNDHEDLLDSIEILKESVRQHAPAEDVDCACDTLIKYVDTHLTSEESAMQGMRYPDFATHKSKHDEFRAWLKVQREQRQKSPETWEGALAVEFLEHWWRNHILKVDMAYKEFMEDRKPELDKRLGIGADVKHP